MAVKHGQAITTVKDITHMGNILSIWAHPDDESFYCAGIMAAAVQNSQAVACLTATKGEAGIRDKKRWPAERLPVIRAAELYTALDCLGVHHHHWLGYHDGQCQKVPFDEAVKQIAGFIDDYQPDTILTFGPDGMTGHPDHKTVSKWVSEAVRGRNVTVYHAVEETERYNRYLKAADKELDIYFNIDKPPLRQAKDCDIAFKLSTKLADCKRRALRSMFSQTAGMFHESPDTIDALVSAEYFVKAK